jgi:Family of unknown function (DUF6272)
MNNTLLSHYGNITPEYIDGVIEVVNSFDEKPSLIRKICFLIVESLQNVVHHSDKDENGDTRAYFELIKNEDSYTIKTGNLISKEKTEELEKRMDCVLKTTDEEAKEKILNKLKDEGFSEKGGAGIGLLSIKRKTNNQYHYHTEELNETHNLIHFEIII